MTRDDQRRRRPRPLAAPPARSPPARRRSPGAAPGARAAQRAHGRGEHRPDARSPGSCSSCEAAQRKRPRHHRSGERGGAMRVHFTAETVESDICRSRWYGLSGRMAVRGLRLEDGRLKPQIPSRAVGVRFGNGLTTDGTDVMTAEPHRAAGSPSAGADPMDRAPTRSWQSASTARALTLARRSRGAPRRSLAPTGDRGVASARWRRRCAVGDARRDRAPRDAGAVLATPDARQLRARPTLYLHGDITGDGPLSLPTSPVRRASRSECRGRRSTSCRPEEYSDRARSARTTLAPYYATVDEEIGTDRLELRIKADDELACDDGERAPEGHAGARTVRADLARCTGGRLRGTRRGRRRRWSVIRGPTARDARSPRGTRSAARGRAVSLRHPAALQGAPKTSASASSRSRRRTAVDAPRPGASPAGRHAWRHGRVPRSSSSSRSRFAAMVPRAWPRRRSLRPSLGETGAGKEAPARRLHDPAPPGAVHFDQIPGCVRHERATGGHRASSRCLPNRR